MVFLNIGDLYNEALHGAKSTLEKLVDPATMFGSVLKVWDLVTIPGEPPEANL